MASSLFGREGISRGLFGLFVVAGCLYFTFAATKGPYGIYEKGRIEAREVFLTRELAEHTTTRAMVENRVKRLSDGYLDLDLLDEQARQILGMIRDDEIVIR